MNASAITICLRKSFDFSGRGSRSEYWLFYASAMFINLILSQDAENHLGKSVAEYVGLGTVIVLLTTVLAAGSRRLHDINRSGWWQAFLIIPILPFLFLTDNQWDYLESTGYEALNAINIYILPLLLIYLVVAVLLWLYWFTKKAKPEKNRYN